MHKEREAKQPMLQAGDPRRAQAGTPQPASFSRFILPFAYQLENDSRQTALRQHELRWKEHNDLTEPGITQEERRDYFAPEIAELVFDRAKRFKLYGIVVGDAHEFTASVFPNINTKVALAVPELIVFEWPAKATGAEDLLQIGLLVIELRFVGEQVDLASVMQINELYRYFKNKYAEHDANSKRSTIFRQDPLRAHFASHNQLNAPQDLRAWAGLMQLPLEIQDGNFYKITADSGVWPDTRAFVHACGVYPKASMCFQSKNDRPENVEQKAQSALWCHWLNVDACNADLDLSVSAFEQDWARKRTYMRWAHCDALYGFSSHSAMMLTSYCDEPPTFQHFRTLYFDQSCLLLVIRTALFRYSRRISELARKLRTKPHDKTAKSEFRKLDQTFALFVQLYQFPLLSNQQQGIEMYELQRAHMDIDELFKELQDEIRHMHQSIDLEHDHKFRILGASIAVIALLQLVQPIKEWIKDNQWSDSPWSCALMTVTVIGAILFGFYQYWIARK